jgi:hypothetical protein
MNTSFSGRNMVATPVGNVPADNHRIYLAVVATTEITVTISGGEPFTLDAGSVWSPIPAPINDIVFTGTGTLILG